MKIHDLVNLNTVAVVDVAHNNLLPHIQEMFEHRKSQKTSEELVFWNSLWDGLEDRSKTINMFKKMYMFTLVQKNKTKDD